MEKLRNDVLKLTTRLTDTGFAVRFLSSYPEQLGRVAADASGWQNIPANERRFLRDFASWTVAPYREQARAISTLSAYPFQVAFAFATLKAQRAHRLRLPYEPRNDVRELLFRIDCEMDILRTEGFRGGTRR